MFVQLDVVGAGFLQVFALGVRGGLRLGVAEAEASEELVNVPFLGKLDLTFCAVVFNLDPQDQVVVGVVELDKVVEGALELIDDGPAG